MIVKLKRANTKYKDLTFGQLYAVIGIEADDFAGSCFGAGTEVLLIDDAVLVYDKSVDAGNAIFGRPCDKCEACDHVAIDHIVVAATGDIVALSAQDAEMIAEIAFVGGDRTP